MPGRLGGGDATDSRLARRAAEGDRAALAVLLERHFDYVSTICRRIVRNATDAEDARQQALLLVARRITTFEGRSEFRTWLHRIAVNAALDVAERRARGPQPLELEVEPEHQEFAGGDDGLRVDVDAALNRLPEPFRTAVVLSDLCDLSYEEIAERLDVPMGTVRSRIARGRQRLAGDLPGYGRPTATRPVPPIS